MPPARTHGDVRKVLCCVCGKKSKSYSTCKQISVVNKKQIEMVKNFVFKDYDVENPMHPTALCLSCNTVLLAYNKVKHYI